MVIFVNFVYIFLFYIPRMEVYIYYIYKDIGRRLQSINIHYLKLTEGVILSPIVLLMVSMDCLPHLPPT